MKCCVSITFLLFLVLLLLQRGCGTRSKGSRRENLNHKPLIPNPKRRLLRL